LQINIRNECEEDFKEVEELTREAFWNLYVPGCDEHYLAHLLRTHPDFIPELDLVAVCNGTIIGNIMYTKSHIVDELNNKIDTITFGPISVLPDYQRRGVGTALIQHSRKIAVDMKYRAIIIQGHPNNYCKHGFKSSFDFAMSDSEGNYPYGLLVLELEHGALQGHRWKYYLSKAYESNIKAADEFDKKFICKNKEYRYTQEEFSIASRAYLK
jgi:putative acetyltransferase